MTGEQAAFATDVRQALTAYVETRLTPGGKAWRGEARLWRTVLAEIDEGAQTCAGQVWARTDASSQPRAALLVLAVSEELHHAGLMLHTNATDAKPPEDESGSTLEGASSEQATLGADLALRVIAGDLALHSARQILRSVELTEQAQHDALQRLDRILDTHAAKLLAWMPTHSVLGLHPAEVRSGKPPEMGLADSKLSPKLHPSTAAHFH